MPTKWLAAASLTLATLALSTGAQAASIVRTYDIEASRFVQDFGADTTHPQDPVHLNVTLAFDNSANSGITTSGLSVNAFDLPYGMEFAYTVFADGISLATDLVTDTSCSSARGTFCAFIHNATSAHPTLIFFQNSLDTPAQNVWRAETFALSFSDAAGVEGPGVPEPGVWAMLLVGFTGMGTMLRRRRTLALRNGGIALNG